jgi:aminotransferase
VALGLPRSYYRQMAEGYLAKRNQLLDTLRGAGMVAYRPRGAYYIMTNVAGFHFEDDLAFTRHLVEEIGVAAVPGSSFYYSGSRGNDKTLGSQQVRFAFCKRPETLAAAAERLNRLTPR